MISNGEVVAKTANDFIGDAVGVSDTKTKAILEMAQGKVHLPSLMVHSLGHCIPLGSLCSSPSMYLCLSVCLSDTLYSLQMHILENDSFL